MRTATFTWMRVAKGLLSVQTNADILSTRRSWIGASPRALVMSSSTGGWAVRPRSPARPWAFHWRTMKSKEKEVDAADYSSHSDKAAEPQYPIFQIHIAQTSYQFLAPQYICTWQQELCIERGYNVLHSEDVKWSLFTKRLCIIQCQNRNYSLGYSLKYSVLHLFIKQHCYHYIVFWCFIYRNSRFIWGKKCCTTKWSLYGTFLWGPWVLKFQSAGNRNSEALLIVPAQMGLN